MRDNLRIIINLIKRAQVSRSGRDIRGYHNLASDAQTPKFSRVFDGGNYVLHGLRDHGLKSSCGDVVER